MKTAKNYETRPTAELVPYAKNARTHSKAQVDQIAESIKRFGFTNPVLIDGSGGIIAGHGRVLAAKKLKMDSVPTLTIDHLTDDEKRAYVLADNKLALNGGWDESMLAEELKALGAAQFDTSVIGFTAKELAKLLGEEKAADVDDVPAPETVTDPISKLGDVWKLGDHVLICGDSCADDAPAKLVGKQKAAAVFTDPPYAIYGSATGIAADITDDKMVRPFFKSVIRNITELLQTFGHVYVCCDWRSWASWWEVIKGSGLTVKNMVVWDKGGGLGTMYANAHELIMFGSYVPLQRHMAKKVSGERMVKGQNVWRVNRAGRDETGEERQHNAQKPVELVIIALENSTKPGEWVVDFFGGSGTTLIACEKLGRRCAMMEVDPRYMDLIITRWQGLTGQKAIHAETGKPFGE